MTLRKVRSGFGAAGVSGSLGSGLGGGLGGTADGRLWATTATAHSGAKQRRTTVRIDGAAKAAPDGRAGLNQTEFDVTKETVTALWQFDSIPARARYQQSDHYNANDRCHVQMMVMR